MWDFLVVNTVQGHDQTFGLVKVMCVLITKEVMCYRSHCGHNQPLVDFLHILSILGSAIASEQATNEKLNKSEDRP